MKIPKRLNRTAIYKSDWINVYTDKVEMPSGKIIEKYHVLDYPNDSVVVLITNTKGEICFVESLRYSTQKVEWELPAGGIDANEEITKAAQREVKEETGFDTTNLQFEYSFNPSNGMSNQTIHIVSGKAENQQPSSFDTDEVLAVHWLSIAEVKELIRTKKLTDGISFTAVLYYLTNLS